MSESSSSRRVVLRTFQRYSLTYIALQALSSTAAPPSGQVPWSAGSERPRVKAPDYSCDCHLHIYDSRFPFAITAGLKPQPATVEDYRLLQKRLGTSRCVLVQPSSYGTDNRCLLDALQQFGSASARGIAVVNPTISDAELREMDAAGVRGIRFNMLQSGATTLDMLAPLSRRITALGWQIQVNMSPSQIVAARDLLTNLPCPIVFDHFAHIISTGSGDPAFPVIARLLETGKGWLKLSGAYMEPDSLASHYAASIPIARAYIAAAPGQLVWGSDWPHPTTDQKPDDAELFDLLGQWAPDPQERSKILVDNPARLYGFR